MWGARGGRQATDSFTATQAEAKKRLGGTPTERRTMAEKALALA